MTLSTKDMQASQVCHTLLKHDISTSACHIGGNGHSSLFTCVGNDLRLTLVVLGIEHLVCNAHAFEYT